MHVRNSSLGVQKNTTPKYDHCSGFIQKLSQWDTFYVVPAEIAESRKSSDNRRHSLTDGYSLHTSTPECKEKPLC